MPESTAATQVTPTPTPWPDGVVHRYLTDAGKALANSDLAVNIHTYDRESKLTRISCSACPWEHISYGNPSMESWGTEEYYERYSRDGAHSVAQQHAEKCRALPRPAVTA